MISYKEFVAIQSLLKKSSCNANNSEYIFENQKFYVFKSLEEVITIISGLEKKGYISEGKLTRLALEEIEPLKVRSAIILAAGSSDISAKSIHSMPKGLFMKNGETLIERQIRQLKEVGITDITVVVGYKQELYFFLMDKWNVNLVINPDLKKNNIYSLFCAIDKLSSTYICNCDNYFEENPFSQYEFNSYHATVHKEDATRELLVKTNESGRILDVYSGDKSGECIYGHAYLDPHFSSRFKKYLRAEISNFRVSSLFWEEFFAKHVDNLDMYSHHYSSDEIAEFDSIQEIQNIDGLFLGNVSKIVNAKICEVLHCQEGDIQNIEILQKGLTNILFTFVVKGQKYIFRYPGDSSSFFIYRKNEVRAQQLAAKAKVDNTFVYIDESGIKISKFISNVEDIQNLYYKDIDLMKLLATKIRQFHNQSIDMKDWKEFDYNPIQQCERLMKEASKVKGNLFNVFATEWAGIKQLYHYTEMDNIPKVMCHNDINGDNCLLTKNSFDIIDWEFAGWNDPAYDFGRVLAGYDFDDPKIDIILEAYFGRPATPKERLHWIAYIGIHNWYYVGWALYKESINESSRDWMLFFYKQVKRVIAYALPRYQRKIH
jgi:CTP:phosphocholine cytidylyltransferase-like protein/thiamine kinase-like enzyme